MSIGDNPFPLQEDFFQRLADGAPVLIWMSGLDMGCFYFNRAWLDFRGRTLEQEQGNGWAEGVHPDDLQRCINHYVGCFERRVAFAMSYRLLHHTGEHRWILDRGVPHLLPDGTFLGYFGGCAEIGGDTILRHSQLSGSLAAMKEFAGKIATEGIDTMRALQHSVEQPLSGVLRPGQEDHYARVKAKRATDQMRQLAGDMEIHARIGYGRCIPKLSDGRR